MEEEEDLFYLDYIFYQLEQSSLKPELSRKKISLTPKRSDYIMEFVDV